MKTSPFAIASLIVSFALCCCGLNGVVAIALGLVALRQIKGQPEVYTGRGLALTGVIVGVVSILGALAFWGFMISRYYEVKPVAEQATIHIQRGEFEQAKVYFVDAVRDNPAFDQELAGIRDYLNQRGQLEELTTGYSINVNMGATTVVFNGVFASGTARLTCVFVEEEGEWRLLRYHVL